MPSGTGFPGSLIFLAVVVLAAIAAFYAFTFRVSPDEMGVVMRFGKVQPAGAARPALPHALPDR